MANLTFKLETSSGGMGDGWKDDHAANTAYAYWLHHRIVEWAAIEYPEHNVEVIVEALNQDGASLCSVQSDDLDTDTDSIAESLRYKSQDLWGEFCAIAPDEFSHLIAID